MIKQFAALLLIATIAHGATTNKINEPVKVIDPTSTYSGTVIKVMDGDTIRVKVATWPLPFNPVDVRLDGIDTPESMSQWAKCTKEQKLGLIAKAWLKDKLKVGSIVTLLWTGHKEKYGRLLAIVYLGDENINAKLIKLGYAHDYHGKTKSSWCK